MTTKTMTSDEVKAKWVFLRHAVRDYGAWGAQVGEMPDGTTNWAFFDASSHHILLEGSAATFEAAQAGCDVAAARLAEVHADLNACSADCEARP